MLHSLEGKYRGRFRVSSTRFDGFSQPSAPTLSPLRKENAEVPTPTAPTRSPTFHPRFLQLDRSPLPARGIRSRPYSLGDTGGSQGANVIWQSDERSELAPCKCAGLRYCALEAFDRNLFGFFPTRRVQGPDNHGFDLPGGGLIKCRDLHSEAIWIAHGEIVAGVALHAFDARALDPGPQPFGVEIVNAYAEVIDASRLVTLLKDVGPRFPQGTRLARLAVTSHAAYADNHRSRAVLSTSDQLKRAQLGV